MISFSWGASDHIQVTQPQLWCNLIHFGKPQVAMVFHTTSILNTQTREQLCLLSLSYLSLQSFGETEKSNQEPTFCVCVSPLHLSCCCCKKKKWECKLGYNIHWWSIDETSKWQSYSGSLFSSAVTFVIWMSDHSLRPVLWPVSWTDEGHSLVSTHPLLPLFLHPCTHRRRIHFIRWGQRNEDFTEKTFRDKTFSNLWHWVGQTAAPSRGPAGGNGSLPMWFSPCRQSLLTASLPWCQHLPGSLAEHHLRFQLKTCSASKGQRWTIRRATKTWCSHEERRKHWSNLSIRTNSSFDKKPVPSMSFMENISLDFSSGEPD